jgi:hypothetical protein
VEAVGLIAVPQSASGEHRDVAGIICGERERIVGVTSSLYEPSHPRVPRADPDSLTQTKNVLLARHS